MVEFLISNQSNLCVDFTNSQTNVGRKSFANRCLCQFIKLRICYPLAANATNLSMPQRYHARWALSNQTEYPNVLFGNNYSLEKNFRNFLNELFSMC